MQPVNPAAGFAEIDEQTPSQLFAKGATLQTQDSTGVLRCSDRAWDGHGPERRTPPPSCWKLKATPVPAPPAPPPPGGTPSDPVETLIRQFEPELFFHPQETVFPVDAKRYVENAALWAARAAFDNKEAWGGMPGDPFPRQPLVTAGNLAALPGEPGTYLGTPSFLLDDARNERFLELGGWKDKSEAHEPDVTATSANVYADRTAIVNRYQNENALKDSRFWYHAELYDTDRLTRLAQQVTAPDLGKLLLRLTNPMLLCYDPFFPAHDQSVGKGVCTNIEASEVACHAGDWQCIAIMLKGDASGALANAIPKFFGHTGSRPAPDFVNGNPVFPPHQFDDDGLTVMKVAQWRPATGATANQPEVADDHPRLYVAQGSHSLYTTPGSHEVDPFPQGSTFECAAYDTVSLLPPDDGDNAITDYGAFALKLLAGGLLNIGPAGLVAALAAAAVEGVLPHAVGLDPPRRGPGEPGSGPDRGGATGKTVQPAGLTLADGGTDVSDWAARQGLQLNGRTYDFKVDRTNQLWWPGEETTTGFRGRWGQCVTSDFLPRRAGPRFPPYWKMFLLALADGDTRNMIDLTM